MSSFCTVDDVKKHLLMFLACEPSLVISLPASDFLALPAVVRPFQVETVHRLNVISECTDNFFFL